MKITNFIYVILVSVSIMFTSCQKETTEIETKETGFVTENEFAEFITQNQLNDISIIKVGDEIIKIDEPLINQDFEFIKNAFETYEDISYAYDLNAVFMNEKRLDEETRTKQYLEMTVEFGSKDERTGQAYSAHQVQNEYVPTFTSITFYDGYNLKGRAYSAYAGSPTAPVRTLECSWSVVLSKSSFPSWMNDKAKSFTMSIYCKVKFDSDIQMFADSNFGNRINRFGDNQYAIRRKGTKKAPSGQYGEGYYGTGWNWNNISVLSSNVPWAPTALNNINGFRIFIKPGTHC